MGMIKFLLGFAGIVGICVWSFNYVEGHNSTELKNMISQYSEELERISEKCQTVKRQNVDMEIIRRRLCALLEEAEIGSDLCVELDLNKAEASPLTAEIVQIGGES